MPRFRRKNRSVEAFQWDGVLKTATITEIDGKPYVYGAQGHVPVNAGDWIIEEVDGSGYYPCSDANFRELYIPEGTH